MNHRAHLGARRRARAAALAVLLLAAALHGCTRPAPPNILLIVVDTLRADRVGISDAARRRTPFLDALAAQAFVFHNAYAQSSWTNASIASLLTSRYQSQHHVMSFWATLAGDEITLPELLGQRGYATGGFIANFLLRGDLGYAQGFDRYRTFSREGIDPRGKPTWIKATGEQVNQGGLAWLDELEGQGKAGKPAFLYLHYMEPHAPYDPPDRLLDAVLDGRPRPDLAAVNKRVRVPTLGKFSDALVADIIALYDAEVLRVDERLRELFAALRERGFLRNTIIVITSDHGEEFREHGTMGHHQALFEESIRVPLLILLPGHDSRVDVDAIVSLTDLAPTLLELVDVPRPPTFAGASLTSLMGIAKTPAAPQGAPSGIAFSELIKETTERVKPHERALITRQEKVILNVGGQREHYDLSADPGETNADALPAERRQQLAATLEDFLARTRPSTAPAAERTLDPETLERMRALGYRP